MMWHSVYACYCVSFFYFLGPLIQHVTAIGSPWCTRRWNPPALSRASPPAIGRDRQLREHSPLLCANWQIVVLIEMQEPNAAVGSWITIKTLPETPPSKRGVWLIGMTVSLPKHKRDQ